MFVLVFDAVFVVEDIADFGVFVFVLIVVMEDDVVSVVLFVEVAEDFVVEDIADFVVFVFFVVVEDNVVSEVLFVEDNNETFVDVIVVVYVDSASRASHVGR